MDKTIGGKNMGNVPNGINVVLETYFDVFESTLPNMLEAYYLYGSASLGAYTDGISDIDFVAVCKRKVTQSDVIALKEIHNTMQKRFKKPILDGWYIHKKDLMSLEKGKNACLRFNDGKFHGFQTFDPNSIDAFQLKKYGLTIKGERMENLDYTVDWDILISNMRDNLNTYWLNWIKKCKKITSPWYFSLYVSLGTIEWGVLGVTRLYYTFRENDLTSKAGAGNYALEKLPQKWHKIIKESMRLRNGQKTSYYNSIFQRRKDALDYIQFIIHECNSIF